MTTTAFASVCEPEWDDGITEGLTETTTLNNQIYVFGQRRWVKPARKWKTPLPQTRKEEEQSKVNTTSDVQAQTTQGVFMFGSAARIVSETKGSLPALLEVPSNQERVGNQVKTTKKPVC